MAKTYRVPIDLQKNELQNARIQNLASAPAAGSSVAGQIYYDTVANDLYYFNGTSWVPVGTTVSPATSVVSSTTYGQASAVGTSLNYARQDHVHGTPATPTAANVGAVTNSGLFASARADVIANRPTAATFGTGYFIATDTGNAYYSNATSWSSVSVGATATPTAETIGLAGAAGTVNGIYANSDHVHAFPTAASAGNSAVGDAAAAGSSASIARADHVHGREAFGAVVAQTFFGAASANGSATTVAHSDHTHGTPATPTAAGVGAVANNGNAPYLQTGTAAARPNTGLTIGGIYVDNDDFLAFVATSATVYSQIAPFALVAAVTAITPGSATAAGTATTYARGDHAHGLTSAIAGASAVGDAASAGSASSVSRSDHVHGREAFGAATSGVAYGQANSAGSATTVSHSDHVHGTPAAPTASSVGAVANAGGAPYVQTGTAAARPTSGLTVGGLYVDNDDFLAYIATSATVYSQVAPFAAVGAITAVTAGGAAAAGTATTYARGDHAHSLGAAIVGSSAVGDAAAQGSATTVARSDHTHGREAFGAVVAQTAFGGASANGSATTVAHSDHTHGTPPAPTASSVGAVANNGGAPGLQTGTAAGRPSTGQTIGNIYADNDDGLLWIATGATTFSQLVPFAVAGTIVTVSGTASAAGTAITYARGDHQHGLGTAVAAGASAVGDVAAAGTSATAARADHVHGREAFGAVTAQTTFAAASANGSATTLARSDHTHGTPSHTGAAHSAVSISSLAAPTADVAWAGFKITGLADPVSAQDAATKNYVDGQIVGLTWKQPARLATAADLNGAYTATATVITGPANTALANIDGVAPAVNDRILVKNAANAANNGLYVVTSLGSGASQYVLTRASDSQTGAEIVGEALYVEQGTVGGSLVYTTSTPNTTTGFTLGTTAINYTQFSGASVATAGAGLTATGNVFAVGAGTGITVNADNVAVDTSVVARKYATAFGDGSATSYVITHNLNTQDVQVTVYTNSGVFDEVECDVQHTSVNTITLLFSVAPTANQFRVSVVG